MVFKKIIFQNRYVALETPSRPPPPFMANTILNFHFDYLNTSLSCFATMYIMGGDVVPIEEIDVIAYVYFGIILEPLGDYLFNVS